MADVTELRCWPSCVDALDWSHDNIIAFASDERVELLFPNTVCYERDDDVPQWQHVPLQVPWFSSDEQPVKIPAPLPSFSVGEEISPSVPIRIGWSPPGLAKHRRCALAVLTSNLVLSLWSVDGKVDEPSSWNRRLLINHTLTEYFSKSRVAHTSHITSNAEEQLRLRSRLRSFTWAPALPDVINTMGTQTFYGRQFLAVTNDDNQIVFLAVDSPTSTLGSKQIWTADALTHLELEPEEDDVFIDPLVFDDRIKQQRNIPQIAWSPWVLRGHTYHSVIAYATNEQVKGRSVSWANDELRFGGEVSYAGKSLRHSGSMSWCPEFDDKGRLTLAIFATSGLVYLTISVIDAAVVDRAEHDLDGRWDQVSGTVWDLQKDSSPCLHFCSLFSTVESPTAVIEKTPGGLMTHKSPSWKEKIENQMVLFSVKNDLKGHSKAKVYGLTSSPLGDFIAACNSMHPSDSIEYGPPAGRRGTVALSTLKQYSRIRESFPSRNITAEGALFTLKKLAENTVEDAEQIPAFTEEIVEKLLLAYPPMRTAGGDVLTAGSNTLEDLIRGLKVNAIFEENTLRDRYSVLLSYATNDHSSNELARTLISYRLASALRKLPTAISQTTFSKEISLHHEQLITLIESLLVDDDEDAMDTGHTLTGTEATAGRSVSMSKHDGAALVTDQCDFCTLPIPFSDLTTATCLGGHQFPRCGISYLAIQAPGITKYCGICSTPFLCEEFVRAQEIGDDTDAEPPVTLARVLFQACDTL
ncbi:hypothetical protein E8E13_010517 [Curvularia kusanoi]|uniref:Transcription factor IIIC 90kDa subunit N-terminal domain-containing protein n=1 Tax=Curvularia kusanoi TaxID=90978 RepID=A0A9P4TQ40_CURKU|nr:hypothetical protein E8E13_010517 [Curvularia kusanoi]